MTKEVTLSEDEKENIKIDLSTILNSTGGISSAYLQMREAILTKLPDTHKEHFDFESFVLSLEERMVEHLQEEIDEMNESYSEYINEND